MKYCLGLRFSRERPITGRERALIEEALQLAVRRRILAVGGAWLIPVFVIGLFELVPAPAAGKQVQGGLLMTALVGVLCLALFIGPAVMILLAVDAKRRVRILTQSRESSVVEIYESEHVPGGKQEWDEDDLQGPLVLNRVPESGLLLDQFSLGSPLTIAPCETVGDALNPIPFTANVGGRRDLTASELEEIGRIMKNRLSLPWPVYAMTAFCCLAAVVTITDIKRSNLFVAIFLCLATGVLLRYIQRSWKLKSLVNRDRFNGYVESHGDANDIYEVLPLSRLTWTLESRPSDLRIVEGPGPRKI